MMCQLPFSFADLRFRADCKVLTIDKNQERKEYQPIHLAEQPKSRS